MQVDYIIRGGRVIDPASGCDEIRDIYIRGMHIVDPGNTVWCKSDRIIDADGMIVCPGLIDFHAHLFHEGSAISIYPDLLAAHGVTSAVDAGSAGAAAYEAFYKTVVTRSVIRIKGFLNVYSGGQLDSRLCEDYRPSLFDIDRMERLIAKYRDNILGLKLRLSKGIVPEETRADYLKACVELAEELDSRLGTKLRVCVHTTNAPVPAGELADCLRPGDIFSHCYQGVGNTIAAEDDNIVPAVRKARERGVLFDSANGRGNFSLQVAQKALAAGFLPDIISSDLSAEKYNLPWYAKNLPAVLSKYLCLGMDLPSVLRCCTSTPAEILGLSGLIGTLRTGALADIAILQLREKDYIQKDCFDTELPCHVMLVPQLTMIAGEVQYCQADYYL